MKKALLLNAVNPLIGGVLIRGEKGTGKSTAVRGLIQLLRTGNTQPPFINLPLNATEEMVIGTLDLDETLRRGRRSFQPGLLARAHGGFLYIDEVNLLEDHIIDIILDAAASGKNTVEREGISFTHPAEFVLIGSMNPEEGDLRPHFLDRFGFCIDTVGEMDLETRVEMMELREEYDSCPERIVERFAEAESELRERVRRAKTYLPGLHPDQLLPSIAELCIENRVAGHRADLTILQGAKACAALDERTALTLQDLQYAAALALPHRSRLAEAHQKHPDNCTQEESHFSGNTAEKIIDKAVKKVRQLLGTEKEQENFSAMNKSKTSKHDPARIQIEKEDVFEIGDPFQIRQLPVFKDRRNNKNREKGKRSKQKTRVQAGRYIRSRPSEELKDIALDATIRAAAPYQRERKGVPGLQVVIRKQDIRVKVREKKSGSLFLFVVDASGSMAAQQRMIAVKGAIFSLLMDAYQKRDKAAMITFQKREAHVLLPPTSSIDLAGKRLRDLPVGGRTPLSHGLLKGYALLQNYLMKEPDASPIVVVLTDGKANVPLNSDSPFSEALGIAGQIGARQEAKYVVVDTLEARQANLGTARGLAAALRADYYKIEDLQCSDLVQIARSTSV